MLARALTEGSGKIVRVLAAHADAPHLQTAVNAKQGVLGAPTRSAEHVITPMSYDAAIRLAAETAPTDRARWDALSAWTRDKIGRIRSLASSSPRDVRGP